MVISEKAAQAIWLCLVETQQAIVLHLNDTGNPAYIKQLANQHAMNNLVLSKVKEG